MRKQLDSFRLQVAEKGEEVDHQNHFIDTFKDQINTTSAIRD